MNRTRLDRCFGRLVVLSALVACHGPSTSTTAARSADPPGSSSVVLPIASSSVAPTPAAWARSAVSEDALNQPQNGILGGAVAFGCTASENRPLEMDLRLESAIEHVAGTDGEGLDPMGGLR